MWEKSYGGNSNKSRKRNASSQLEAAEQVALFEWASYFPELRWMYSVPNGGARAAAVAAHLKRQGVKAGISDICLPLARGDYHGLYIEMKRSDGKGRTSPLQQEFIDFANSEDYLAVVCEGTDQAVDTITNYLNQKKWKPATTSPSKK